MTAADAFLEQIESIPAIDVHSQLHINSPQAESPADILLPREIEAELRAAGAPPQVFDIVSGREKLEKVHKRLPEIANTAAYWCLRQILADLFGIAQAPHELSADALWERVAEGSSGTDWPDNVLRKANVSHVMSTCVWHRPVPQASGGFSPVVTLDSLLNEPHTPRALERLTDVTGQTVYEAADLKKAIVELFERAKAAGAVAASGAYNPQVDFEPGSLDAADRVLSLVLLGQKTNRDDRRTLRSYVLDVVLAQCAQHSMPFQLMLGVRRGAAGDRSISGYETGMLVGYSEVFVRHADVLFDVIPANLTLAHEVAALARVYANVYVSGCTGFVAFPRHVRSLLRERIEMLPKGKCCALFSDEACAEWVYGRCRLARRELAAALSQMVDEGYLTSAAAMDVARGYLSENARRIYRL